MLDAELVKSADSPGTWGWRYHAHDLTEKQLVASPQRRPWSPVELNETQFVIMNKLCKADVDADDPSFQDFIRSKGLDPEAFVDGLIATTLVARNGRCLTLTTEKCLCAILPDGRMIAGEDGTGRLSRWLRSPQATKPIDPTSVGAV